MIVSKLRDINVAFSEVSVYLLRIAQVAGIAFSDVPDR